MSWANRTTQLTFSFKSAYNVKFSTTDLISNRISTTVKHLSRSIGIKFLLPILLTLVELIPRIYRKKLTLQYFPPFSDSFEINFTFTPGLFAEIIFQSMIVFTMYPTNFRTSDLTL